MDYSIQCYNSFVARIFHYEARPIAHVKQENRVVPFQKFTIMRLELLHMLMLFSFLPNRNAFASINKRIVLAQPTVILVSYDGFRWDYMEKLSSYSEFECYRK